jgi:multisubunit Na+/H+ antiporter MnhF subunit
VNPWLLSVIVLQSGLIICAWICVRGTLPESIVAMEMSSLIGVISIAMLAEAVGRPAWFDLAIALALVSVPGALLFLAFLERWR